MGETLTISIPADAEGYVLFQCPICFCFFKLLASDYEKANEIYCPSCGMKSNAYVTKDVIELAQTKMKNYAEEELYKAFKNMERNTRGKMLSFKAGRKPDTEPENPIRNKIESMGIAYFECCDKTCKIKPLLIMTGCYCPFCGEK